MSDRKEQLLALLDSSWRELLEEGGVAFEGDKDTGLCPFHDDTGQSFSTYVSDKTGHRGWRCFKCDLSGNLIDFHMKRHGLSFRDALQTLCDRHGIQKAPKAGRTDEPRSGHGRGQPTAEYVYHVAQDQPVFKVTRYDRGDDKDFFLSRYDADLGEYVSGKGCMSGVERVPYRLPEWIDSSYVILVEGEKCADALWAIGLTATTTAGGSSSWLSHYAKHFADKKVLSLPDHDDPGHKYVQAAAGDLHDTATKVVVVELPGLAEGEDVVDWLANGGSRKKLLALARTTPEWAPAEDSAPSAEGSVDGSNHTRPSEEPDQPGAPNACDRPEAQTFTDSGNSARLVALHGERLHHIAIWRKWIVWSAQEGRWITDYGDVHVRELAKDVGRALKVAAAENPDGSAAKKVFAFAFRSLNAGPIKNMVELACGIEGIPLGHEDLDTDPWLLGVRNGTLDLRTGKLLEADPSHLITMQAPVALDVTATAPRWVMAMKEWFPDPDVRSYVQRLAGSALVGSQREHIFIIHYGGGRNGKGAFTRALQATLGPYACVCHLSLLVEQRHSEHDTVKADLFRTRLAVASETEKRVRLKESSVKNLSGGDRIKARRMREDSWEFDPSHSLWLLTNHLPEIRGRDKGIWSRIRVVKWVATFEGKAADTDLDEKLSAEASGILNWLLEGCLLWQKEGLDEPEAVIRETLAYRVAEDIFARFAKDIGLQFREGLEVETGQMGQFLRDWADEQGIRPPQKDLRAWLEANGAKLDRRTVRNAEGVSKRVRFWTCVGVVDSELEAGGGSGQGGQGVAVPSRMHTHYSDNTADRGHLGQQPPEMDAGTDLKCPCGAPATTESGHCATCSGAIRDLEESTT
jgi:putative DNA primase/helicase